MQITIRTARCEATPELHEYLETKLEPFTRVLPTIGEAYVILSHDAHHKTGDVSTVEISLRLEDDSDAVVLAHDCAATFHEAIDMVVAKLKIQATNYKEKRNAKDRGAIRDLKDGE